MLENWLIKLVSMAKFAVLVAMMVLTSVVFVAVKADWAFTATVFDAELTTVR